MKSETTADFLLRVLKRLVERGWRRGRRSSELREVGAWEEDKASERVVARVEEGWGGEGGEDELVVGILWAEGVPSC